MTEHGIEWEENTGFIHPAQDFFRAKLKMSVEGKASWKGEDLVAVTSQTFRVKEQVEKKIGDQTVLIEKQVERSFAITSTRELTPLKHGCTVAGKLIRAVPTGFGGDRWSRKSIRLFLDGKVSYGEMPGQVGFFNVYAKIRSQLKTYMELEEEEYAFLALWAMHTYFAQMFGTSPILYLNAIKGSGKSKLLEILSYIAFNGLYCVEPSDASIFRIAHSDKATILIDELERIRDDEKGVLRIFLNGRYKRGMVVTRVEQGKDKSMTVQRFDLFGSTALANISGLDTVLEDRCATLILKRALSPLLANSEPEPDEPAWQEIRNDMYCLMLNPDFYNVGSDVPECYDGFKLVRFFLDFWNGNSDALQESLQERQDGFSQTQKDILVFLQELRNVTNVTRSAVTNTHQNDVSDESDVSDASIRGVLSGVESDVSDDTPKQPIITNVTNVTVKHPPYVIVTNRTNVTNVTKPVNFTWLVGRTLQLWKPILVMAACVDGSAMQEKPQGTLRMMLSFAERLTKIKAMEDVTENPDVIIVEALVKCYISDAYYALKALHAKVKEDMEWLKPQGLGRAMKRVGFDTKRKTGKGVEYLITEAKLQALALRLRLDYDGLKKEGAEEREDAALMLEDKHLGSMTHWQGAGKGESLQEALQ